VRLTLGGKCDGQAAGGRTALVLEVVARTLHLLQDAAGMRQQALAGFGEGHTAAIAVEQRLAQLDLERAYLARQRRLSHLQEGSRAREAAHFGHLREVLELLQVHVGESCRNAIADSAGIALMTVQT
jgi:hypothetical protein